MSVQLRVTRMNGDVVWGPREVTRDYNLQTLWHSVAEVLGQPTFMVNLVHGEKTLVPQSPFPAEGHDIMNLQTDVTLQAVVLSQPDKYGLLQELIPKCKGPVVGSSGGIQQEVFRDSLAKLGVDCNCESLPEDTVSWLEIILTNGIILTDQKDKYGIFVAAHTLQDPDEFGHADGVLNLWAATCLGGSDCCACLWVDVNGCGGPVGCVWFSTFWDDDALTANMLVENGTSLAESMTDFFKIWALQGSIFSDAPPSLPPPKVPDVHWAQRKASLYLTVDVGALSEDTDIILGPDTLAFSSVGSASGDRYEFLIELSHPIKKEQSKWSRTKRTIYLKKLREETWTYLTKGKDRMSWIKSDLNKFVDSDDEEWSQDFNVSSFDPIQ